MVETLKISLINIDYNICVPSKCNHECINVCPVNKRNSTDKAIRLERNKKPSIDDLHCTHCKKCIKNCPLNAISYGESKEENRMEVTNIVDIKKWKKSPYLVDKSVFKRYSQVDTIFARVMNDPDFKYYKINPFMNVDKLILSGKLGYSKIDFALMLSAWKLNRFEGYLFDKKDKSSYKYEIDDPCSMSRVIKQVAKASGASLVGITKLDKKWVYTHDRNDNEIKISNNIDNVIVMAIEMDLEAIQSSPSAIGGFATGRGYSQMTHILVAMSEFIGQLGYEAIPAGNGIARSVPLAIDAGIGQYGRHGLLVTEKYGSNVRLFKIFTDMPLKHDKPIDFGVLDFCRTCMRCADTCPSQSISYDKNPSWKGPTKSNNNGILKWYVDVESCYGFWIRNGGDCSTCISSCPFTKNSHWSHKMPRWLIKHLPLFNRLWVKIDHWMGYGKQRDPEEFWSENRTFIQLR